MNKEEGVLSWLLTTDHKRIGILYTVSITFFFFLGGFFALLMRLELIEPRNWLVNGRYKPKLIRVVIATGVIWFLIMISNTLGDYVTRGWLPVPGK